MSGIFSILIETLDLKQNMQTSFFEIQQWEKNPVCFTFCKIPVHVSLFSLTLSFYLTVKCIFTNVDPKAIELLLTNCYFHPFCSSLNCQKSHGLTNLTFLHSQQKMKNKALVCCTIFSESIRLGPIPN